MEDKNYFLPVNWTDGMKISKDHFLQDQYARIQDQAFATGAHINNINYGLLPAVAFNQNAIRLFINVDNQQNVVVKLLNCRAVTPGGYVIDIVQNGANEITDVEEKVIGLSVPFSELKLKSEKYFIVLSVNPYQRNPFGNASAEELPPRIPFTVPQYNLSLLPEENFNHRTIGLYQLAIGKFFIKEQNIQVDENYIPPCVATNAHPELVDVFAGIEEFLSKMELYSIQILQKIILKKQQNELALIVQRLCENILQFTNSNAMVYRWSMLHQPPLHMLSVVASLARVFKNTLDQYIGTHKEELINYFMEWCELRQGEMESLITNLTTHKYAHENINYTVEVTALFTKSISTLFHNLSRLDYIGKKRDANIFVKEEMVKSDYPEIAATKRRSFLAD
jgi:hypothetical protein